MLVLLWVLFFWQFAAPSLADRWAFADGDFTQQFGVFRNLVYRSVAAGRAPLWADCLLSGYPLYADPQTQLFYFPSWITYAVLWLGGWGHYPIGALTAEGIAHYLLISLLLYAFLRGEVKRPAAALIGSVVFTYSGYLTGFPVLQTATIETLAWLPLALIGLRRLAATRRPVYLAGAALALAVAYFGGHPQTFVYMAGLALAYLGYRARTAGIASGRLAAWAVGLVALTAGLSAVQLLPSVQFIALSTRSSLPFDEAARGLLFQDVAQFFVTGLSSYWNYLYVGILPLGLAGFALIAGRSRAARFWGAVLLAGLLLSFGSRGLVYDVLYWLLPPFRLFRGQEHFSLVVAFSLSVLAALGADLALGPLSRKLRGRLRGLRQAVLYLCLTGCVLIAGAIVYTRAGFDPSGRFAERVGLLALFSLLAALALHLRLAWPRARHAWSALLLVVIALDLFVVNRGLNASAPFATYAYTPLLDPVRGEAGFFRVQDDFQLQGHAGCGYGFRQVEAITPYRLASYQAFLDRAPEPVRWSLLGVRYVVTWRQELAASFAVEPAAQAPSAPGVPNVAGITQVYRLAGIEPRRAFLASEILGAPDDDSLYAALAAPGFDLFRTAILRDTTGALVGGTPGEAADSGAVQVQADVPGRVTLAVNAPAPGLLVLSEAWYPGWGARIDGAAARVMPVDGALLGVPVPAGEHTVTFELRAPMLAWGGVISIASLSLAGLLAWKRSRP